MPTTAARCAPACSTRRGDAVVIFDIDYFDLDFLDAAVAQVLAPDGPVIVVGTKRGEGANDKRDPIRKLATVVFSTILRVMFGLRVSDTHGIKAMRRAVVEPYARICTFGQDLFDTELILRVERAGLVTAEIPVEVRELRQARSTFVTARSAYAARTVQTPLGAVEGIPGALTLQCARVVNGEGGQSAGPAWVTVASGRIVATRTGAAPAGAVDLGDAWLCPGFVDVQVNGTDAVDFASASVEQIIGAVDALVAGGTTGLLLTICSAPLDTYEVLLERLERVRSARPESVIGVHLEGPFLGGAPGAHPPAVLQPSDLTFLRRVHDTYGDLVRIVTLAPEADPGLEATRLLTGLGVVVALGHSTVDYDGATAAADAGARMVTHLFNGMGALHHRVPGLPGAALGDPRLVPSIIADFVHVHPVLVKVALQVRTDAVLVTDSVATGPPVVERDGAAYLRDGTLAGSTITMDTAVRNVASLGVPLARAVRYATANPARVLGANDRGRIVAGARADLVALDPTTLAVRAVWVGGIPV